MNLLTVGKTMAKRGMLAPGPPHQQVAQLVALRRWGFGLAGELRQAANRSPKAVAVIDERRGSITYAELLERSERVAAVLQDRGYGEGDRIALLARNHVGAIEVMCGAAAIGVDVVLGNTGLGPAQLAEVMRQQEVAAVIHDDELAEAVSALPVEVEPFGWRATRRSLESLGCEAVPRTENGAYVYTDGGHLTLDCRFGHIPDPPALDAEIKRIPGALETGIFAGVARTAFVAAWDGVRTLNPIHR